MQDSGSRVQDSGCRGQHSGFGVCLEEIVALLEEVAPRRVHRGILQAGFWGSGEGFGFK